MYLLDTNALLFSFDSVEKLSTQARAIIASESRLYISIASLWEIEIKRNLGKLKFPYNPLELKQYCDKLNYTILPISPEYLAVLDSLPKIHGDPFDRIIISTAKKEELKLITSDSIIPKYPVEVVW